jgi:hypothetical protein
LATQYNIPKGTKVNSYIGKPKPSSKKKSSGSSSSSKRSTVRTEVAGNIVTTYYSDGTNKTVETSGKVGGASPSKISQAKAIPKTSSATVNGRVYDNVTLTEVLTGKLSPLTQAILNVKKTADRRVLANRLAQQQRNKTAVEYSLSRLNNGKGTSNDLLIIASQGTGVVKNIVASKNISSQLSNINEINKFKNEIKKQLSPKQKKFLNTLNPIQQERYLFQIAGRSYQPTQTSIGVSDLNQIQKSFYIKLSTTQKRNYLRQISARKKNPDEISLSQLQSNLYRTLSPKDKILYTKQLVANLTVKNYDPKKGYAILTTKDPFSGKETLVDSAGNISKKSASNFVNSLNNQEKIRLRNSIIEIAEIWDKPSLKKLFTTTTGGLDYINAVVQFLRLGQKEANNLLKLKNLTKKDKFIIKAWGKVVIPFLSTSIV